MDSSPERTLLFVFSFCVYLFISARFEREREKKKKRRERGLTVHRSRVDFVMMFQRGEEEHAVEFISLRASFSLF